MRPVRRAERPNGADQPQDTGDPLTSRDKPSEGLCTRAVVETLTGTAGLAFLWPGVSLPSWWLAIPGMGLLVTWMVMVINDAGRTTWRG